MRSKKKGERKMAKEVEAKVKKTHTATLRLEPEFENYIETVAKAVSANNPDLPNVNKTWVMKKLMQFGIPKFEAEFGIKQKSLHNVIQRITI